MTSDYAPIVVFAYNRLSHTRQTVAALQNNGLAAESDLFVFSDAPKEAETAVAVREVRDYLRTVSGFKSVSIVERTVNLGLANSIINGVTTIVNRFGRIVVLEDDMVTSPHFLAYMNEALTRYADDGRVASIHAYLFPVDQTLPEAFFLPGADCWGWATWGRAWKSFNPDGQFLLDELKRRKLMRAFDFNGAYPYSEMLEGQVKGKNDSWAIRWHASAFLAGKLTLYPGRSLVQNIGNDESGTHCKKSDSFDVELSQTPIDLSEIVVAPSAAGLDALERFFSQRKTPFLRRMARKTNALWKQGGR